MEYYKRKYRETFEKAREIYNDSFFNKGVSGHNLMERLFPELKESEDEKIKKAIISYIDYEGQRGGEWFGVKVDDIIAWLEKQGIQKSTDNLTPQEAMDIAVAKCFDEQKSVDSYCQKNCKGFQKTGKCFADEDCKAKREAESIGKAEPKFHEGDWITCRELNTAKIISIDNDKYEVEVIDGNKGFPHINYVDRNFHLWTIADANDGDVLAFKDGTSGTLLYKGYFNKVNGVLSYCRIVRNSFIDKEESGWRPAALSPATKEQRDTLMKAIKDAGYTFDKKVLKKIIKPKFEVGNTIILKRNPTTNKIYFTITDITGGKYWYNERIICNIAEQDEWELLEQKYAWSEEDENRLKDTIYFLDTAKKHYASTVELDACIDWLKSLKDCIQPQNHWKPSEEHVHWLKWAINRLPDTEKANEAEAVLEDLLKQLKEL